MQQLISTQQKQVRLKNGWEPMLDSAAREVFRTMLAGELDALTDSEPPLVADLTVMVGLSGPVRGVLSVHCSAEFAFRAASALIGTDVYEFDESVQDALAEMCNVIAGCFKAKLGHFGDQCSISTPSVISGTDYHFHSIVRGEHIELAFQFEGIPLWVTLDLQPNGNKRDAR